MLDVNGQSIGDGTLELVKFAETASAVNEITVTNSATGNAPEIAATGDDTNIDLKLTPKGTGKLDLDGIKFPNADGTANQILKTDGSGVLSFTDAFTGIAWQSVQTTGFTASAGNAYPCDTTSAGFTVTLPATPSAGDQVQLVDYAGTFDTNALTIDPNGEDIVGQGSNVVVVKDREAITLTYIDSTQGWLPTSGYQEGTQGLGLPYSIDFLVVAGGGGASSNLGAGGAGGFRTSTQSVSPGTVITVTVGSGGARGSGVPYVRGSSGSDSSISGSSLTTITSAGGGGGGANAASITSGLNGGSGGGASGNSSAGVNGIGGSGNTPSTSPSQGNNGGNGNSDDLSWTAGGGGGGSSAVGTQGVSGTGGNGGNGTANSITGSPVTRAGGGAGRADNGGSGTAGTGGGGGAGTAGTANTGGGGGASNHPTLSGAGGSGVVILSVPTVSYSGTSTGSPTVTTSGSNTILQFNGSGSYTA
jgi:hypothetical protein